MRRRIVTLLAGVVGWVALLVAGPVWAQEAVKIGVIQPLTGFAAYDGQSVVEGARLAEEEINAQGGVLSRPLKLLVEDGKADPAESVNAAEKLLVRDRVHVLVGAWASSATLAVMPVISRYAIPMIVETSTATKITELDNKWVFRICSNSGIDAELISGYLVNSLRFKKVAFMAVNSDFGRAVVTAWSTTVKDSGGEVVLAEYHAGGETNFTPSLTKVKNAGVDSIIMTSDLRTVSNIVKQSYELGMGKLNRLVSNGIPAEAIVKLAGKEASEGLLVHNYWVASAPPPGKEKAFDAFRAAYKKRYPEKPVDKYAAFGYDAIRLSVAAIKAAGSTDPAKLRAALESVSYDGLTGPVKFDGRRQSRPYESVSRIKDGQADVIVHLK